MSLQPKWKSSFCSFRVPLMCENYVIMNAQCDQIDAFHMFPIAAGANSFIRPKYDIGIIQEGFPPDCVLFVSVSGILRWNCGINLDLALIHTQVFLVHCRRPKLQLWDGSSCVRSVVAKLWEYLRPLLNSHCFLLPQYINCCLTAHSVETTGLRTDHELVVNWN